MISTNNQPNIQLIKQILSDHNFESGEIIVEQQSIANENLEISQNLKSFFDECKIKNQSLNFEVEKVEKKEAFESLAFGLMICTVKFF
jgi:hypothetical protein